MSIRGRDLQAGDYATTDFNDRRITKVQITARREFHGPRQGVQFKVFPLLDGGTEDAWYDSDWFAPMAGNPQAEMALGTAPAPPHRFSIERHGNGWAIYRGRDGFHHGYNLGQLTECSEDTVKLVERALQATTGDMVLMPRYLVEEYLEGLESEAARATPERQEVFVRQAAAVKSWLDAQPTHAG